MSLLPGETWAAGLRRLIEREIAEGRIAPGTRLEEREIADRFQVSRTPVREAFRLLSADGMVDLRGRDGVIVRSINAHALVEMFQVMAELEGLCARLASRRITSEQRAAIETIHQRLAEAGERGDMNEFYDINKEFHEAIYEASKNEFLIAQTRAMRNRVGFYRRRVTFMPGRVAETLREHEEIMQAVFSHDGERAHQCMRGHINLLGDNLTDFLAQFS